MANCWQMYLFILITYSPKQTWTDETQPGFSIRNKYVMHKQVRRKINWLANYLFWNSYDLILSSLLISSTLKTIYNRNSITIKYIMQKSHLEILFNTRCQLYFAKHCGVWSSWQSGQVMLHTTVSWPWDDGGLLAVKWPLQLSSQVLINFYVTEPPLLDQRFPSNIWFLPVVYCQHDMVIMIVAVPTVNCIRRARQPYISCFNFNHTISDTSNM